MRKCGRVVPVQGKSRDSLVFGLDAALSVDRFPLDRSSAHCFSRYNERDERSSALGVALSSRSCSSNTHRPSGQWQESRHVWNSCTVVYINNMTPQRTLGVENVLSPVLNATKDTTATDRPVHRPTQRIMSRIVSMERVLWHSVLLCDNDRACTRGKGRKSRERSRVERSKE